VLRVFIKGFWSYQTGLKHVQKINDKWNRSKKVELVHAKKNEAVIRLHWDPHMQVTKPICLYNQGAYTFMPLIWDGIPLRLEEKCCYFEGAPYCEYNLKWPQRNRLLEIYSRFFTSRTVLMDTIREMEQDKRIIEQKLKGNGRGIAISGGKIQYNQNRPDGNKITSFTIDGKPLQAEKMYTLATTDYLMEGNSGLALLLDVPKESVAYTGVLLREAVIEYVKENSPLNIPVEGRWDKDENAQPDPEWIRQFEEKGQASLQDK